MDRGAEGEGGAAVGIDTSSGKRKYNLPFPLAGASISSDGRTGAAIEWVYGTPTPSPVTVVFWNFDDGTRLRHVIVPGGKDRRPSGTFTADSRFFVFAAEDADHHIYVVDAKKAEVRSPCGVRPCRDT